MSNKLIALMLLGAAACGDGSDSDDLDDTLPGPTQVDFERPPRPPVACRPSALRSDLSWYGTNREDLTAWLASRGCTSDTYDANNPPVALFDWDNTVSKNDFGDAFTFHLIANDKVMQPPNQDWKQTSPYLTDAAAAALSAACGTAVPAGSPLPTSTNTACANEILSIYVDGVTTGAAAAFAGHNYRWLEATYAWTAQLAAGHTHGEVRGFATSAIMQQLSAPEGTTQTIGTRTLNGWLRIYDQTKDLIAVTKSYGYDVWIITASPQDVIGAFAPLVGVNADHVIGIRSMTDGAGKLTYKFEGCGTVPDNEAKMIPYIQGKRCWVNKVVYGDTTATAMQRRPDGERQVFGAGDSDTDIEFLRDAQYRLVINRQKKEVMCHAYYNEHDSWRINPMFIQPKGAQTSPYPCSTTGCKNEAGVGVPCRDDAGNIIPDQQDLVHN